MPKKEAPDKSKKAAAPVSEAEEAARKVKIKRIKEITEQSFNEAQVLLFSAQNLTHSEPMALSAAN
jgi:hypothetical protein